MTGGASSLTALSPAGAAIVIARTPGEAEAATMIAAATAHVMTTPRIASSFALVAAKLFFFGSQLWP
jgi:hypothetical protein